MGEKIKYRREAAAEQVEQSEKYLARQELIQLGLVSKLSDIDLYHGRAGDGSGWEVDPAFNNAGNNTGNRNVNKRPALNTSDMETAKAFSRSRVDSQHRIAEVHTRRTYRDRLKSF